MSFACKSTTIIVAFLLALSGEAQSSPPGETPSRPELVLQIGHTDWVNDVTFSPDGRFLASGSRDKTIKLWEVATGRLLRSLDAHADEVETIAFSPDGLWLASGFTGFGFEGLDKIIKLWDVATGKEVRTLHGHTRGVYGVAFSPDGLWLASASNDKTVKLWEAATGREIRTLTGHTEAVSNVAFSPDGRRLASGSLDKTIRLWEVATGREIRTLTGHTEAVQDVAFSPDGRLLTSGSRDKTIKLWEVATGREIHTLTGPTDSVGSVDFSPDGRWVASGSGSTDNAIKIWDVATGNEVRTLSGHTNGVYSVAFSPDGRWLASGSMDKTIKLWDANTGKEARALVGRNDQMWNLAISPDERWLVTGSRDKTAKLWGVTSGLELRSLVGHTEAVGAVAFSPDGLWLATGGSYDTTIKLWDVATGKEVRTLRGHTKAVWAVAFSPDSCWLASGSMDGTVLLWDVATRIQDTTLSQYYRGGDINTLSFSPDGHLLAVGDSGHEIYLVEIKTGRRVRTFSGHTEFVTQVDFSPDGRLLACGSRDKTIKVWDVATGSEVRTLAGHAEMVSDVAFSPDGRWLASASDDRTIKIWEVATGKDVRSLAGHANYVIRVVFSPDGRWLASTSPDATVRIWDPTTGEELVSLTAMTPNDEWLAATPEGLFDGSPGALNQICWRFGGNTFNFAPVEIFFNEFYYPGLLADILAGKRPKAERDIALIDRRQPKLTLSLASLLPSADGNIPERNVSIKIEVAETSPDANNASGSGAQDVRLFRNGLLVKAWRGDILGGKNSRATLQAAIPIVAGENRLTAYAFNHDNIKSADTSLVVTGAEGLRRKGTAHILAIGINRYSNPDYNLSYAVPDAQGFFEEVARQQISLGNYGQVEVVSLFDKEATKANILLALARFAGEETGALSAESQPVLEKIKPAQPEDAVLIYYAGHGTAAGPRFYLIPHDLGYTGSRTEIEEAGLKALLEHSISDRELEQAFEKIDAGRLLLVIDACNSGQALEAEEKRRGPMNSKGLAQLAYEKGMYVLTAAQGYQAALEAAQLGHGYLTYALVEEGLKTPSADSSPKDGDIVVREWLDYATQRVPQMQEQGMHEARKLGRNLAMVEGEEKIDDLAKRRLQRPRVFYRREPESVPFIVAKPPAKPKQK